MRLSPRPYYTQHFFAGYQFFLVIELLHLFIERIEVGERGERYSRTAEQKIVIRYRDIGILGAFAKEAQKIAG